MPFINQEVSNDVKLPISNNHRQELPRLLRQSSLGNIPQAASVPMQHVAYTLYHDREAVNTENAGGLTPRLKERVIRMQVETMVAEADKALGLKPTFTEFKEVAKSLATCYPSLQDREGPTGSYVS